MVKLKTVSKSRKAILRIAFLDFECVTDKYVLDTGVRMFAMTPSPGFGVVKFII